jgi:glycosyltransferase involved in cell wall biosynthesis
MKHESAPVSIIVAVYNGKATLQQCIDSVAQQTYLNKELIIIDGGSKDGTVELLKTNSTKFSYWISEPDRGVYNAWNKGLAQAQGEWICFLGADDYFWIPRCWSEWLCIWKCSRQAFARLWAIMRISDDGQSPRPTGESWEQVKESFKQRMCIPQVA